MKNNKLLVLAEDVAFTAPGIVFRNLLLFMQNKYDITLLTAAVDKQLFNTSIKVVEVKKKPYIPHRVEMKMYELFGHNLGDNLLLNKWEKTISHAVDLTAFDCILSFTSHWHFMPLLLGKRIKKKHNSLKWVIYSVDAIPAPSGWVEKKIHDKMIPWISNVVKNCDGFFSANDLMLEYEKTIIGNVKYTGCVYTPWRPCSLNASKKIKSEYVTFLYTGNIYGLRHVRALLKGFQMFNAEQPKSKLVFVGSRIEKDVEPYQSLVESGHIEIHGFTKDLESFLVHSDVLIDIGADVENDVFLSSKIVNYLIIDKPILSITGKGSPSRFMLNNTDSIIHCEHNSHEICEAMQKAASLKGCCLNDRRDLITLFDPQNIANRFVSDIDCIIASEQ